MKIIKRMALALLCTGIVPGTSPASMKVRADGSKPASKRAIDIMEGMALHEKICQMMISYQYAMKDGPDTLSATETGTPLKNALNTYPVGGILYDAASMKSHGQLKSLIAAADSYSEIPPLFAVDEEGGRVARIGKTIGYNRGDGHLLGAMQTYEEEGLQTAYENAKYLAENVSWHGFNLDFAPVADTNSNPNNTVIGTRAYSTDFDTAANLVAAAVQGFHDGGTGCALKHFPGHGDTSGDTHAGSVVLKKSLNELRANELKPFKAGIDAGADIVMLAHIVVEEVGEPTLFSSKLIKDVLRDELNFKGVVVTDGLTMKAMTDVYSSGEITVRGVKAGVDMFLCPDNLEEAVSALEDAVERGEIPEERINQSALRILHLKMDRGLIQ